MISNDNSAGRLYNIFSEAMTKHQNWKARQVWGEIFDVDPDETGVILSKVANMINVIEETKNHFASIEGINNDIYIEPFDTLQKALSTVNFETNWSTFRNQISGSTLTALKFCADYLKGSSTEQVIEQEELNNLREEVETILHQVIDSDLPKELRFIIIDNLEGIRKAILDYQLLGAEGLKRELKYNIGSFYLHSKEFEKEKDNGKIKKYFSLVMHLFNIVKFAYNNKNLLAPIGKHLLGMDIEVE